MTFRAFLETAMPPPKIYDADALDRMARVEGERWKKLQYAQPNSAFGFFAFLKAWKVLEKEGYVGEVSPGDVISMGMVDGIERGDGTIYGEGGYTRYLVFMDGTICYDYSKSSSGQQDLAKAEGFPPY